MCEYCSLSRVQSPFYCRVNNCFPSDSHWIYGTFPAVQWRLNYPSSFVNLISLCHFLGNICFHLVFQIGKYRVCHVKPAPLTS
jgi:hypothetical protein